MPQSSDTSHDHDEVKCAQSTRPRRAWLWFGFLFAILFLGGLPRATPPGWPITTDYAAMVLLPIGAIVMAWVTSLPGWSLGFYGLLSGFALLQGRMGDGRLGIALKAREAIRDFVLTWCVIMFGCWLVCRLAVMLRWRPRRTETSVCTE